MSALSWKIKLLKGLLSRKYASVGPLSATVDVTRRCNLRCLGCRYHSPLLNAVSPGDQSVNDIDLAMFERLCNDLVAIKTRYLILIGEGEPLLHPQIINLIATAKKAGLHVTLMTNGVLLDAGKISAFLDVRLDVLKVSFWATSVEEYHKNHPGSPPRLFEKIVSGLEQTKRMKKQRRSLLPTVILHQPITRFNSRNIGDTVELTCRTGSDVLSFSPLKTWGGMLERFGLSRSEERRMASDLRRLQYRLDALEIQHNIPEVLRRYRIGPAVWRAAPCYMGWLNTRIKVDGTVMPCEPCYLLMGNLQDRSFKDIWNAKPYQQFRIRTRSRQGLASMSKACDCSYCCHVDHNMRVHRIFRWLAFFLVDRSFIWDRSHDAERISA